MGAAALPIAAVALGGGTLINAYGQYQQGQAAAAQDRQNAQFADMQAGDALQRGGREVGLIRMRGSQVIGQQKVAYANSGVDASTGTPAATIASTRMMSEFDAATARNNAAREAWGLRMQGANYRKQADNDEQRGTYGAIGSLLGGTGQAFAMFGGK